MGGTSEQMNDGAKLFALSVGFKRIYLAMELREEKPTPKAPSASNEKQSKTM